MISTRLKLLREKLNLSQKEFGKRVGVSRDVIGNIEYERVEPKEPFLTHLCDVFEINKEWLLTGKGEMTDKNIESKKRIYEALELIDGLMPELQDYAIQQLNDLLALQDIFHEKEKEKEK